jgi:deoxyribonuclease IV
MYLGAHIGISQGLAPAVSELTAIHGEALQIFSKSPQMWAGPPIAADAAAKFRDAVREQGVKATAVHHGYLANLASPKKFTLQQSRKAFRDEIARAELLGVNALIFHPGAHLKTGVDSGVKTLAESLTGAFEEYPEGTVRLLVENMAGQGTTLGSTLEELKGVLDLVGEPTRVGVAIDTCHLFASGVEFRTDEGYGRFLDHLRSTIGTATVGAFHLNDAKADLGSHLDRHENIGKGQIGLDGFRHFVTDPTWATVPGFLETPLDDDSYARYAEDLATLRSLVPVLEPPPAAPAPAAKRGHSSRAKGP